MTLIEIVQLLGNVGEFLGAMAVMVTLFYLATQIRQNTDSVKESNLRNQTDRSIGHSRFVTSTPGLMSVYLRAQKDPSQLTEEERWLFGTYLFSMCLDYQNQYRLYSRTDDISKSMERNILYYLSQAGGKNWWKTGQRMLDEDFTAYVNGLLSESQAATRLNDGSWPGWPGTQPIAPSDAFAANKNPS